MGSSRSRSNSGTVILYLLFPFGRYAALPLPVSALVGLVTLTFDLESGAHYCSWVDNLPTNFGLPRTFRSRLIVQHLLDASRDLATLTLKITALVADAGLRAPSVYQV